jgi:alpha-galactosidase
MNRCHVFLSCVLGLCANTLPAIEVNEIPKEAVNDAVMASPADVAEVANWFAESITGVHPVAEAQPIKIELLRQDHSTLQFRQSCMETPIKIGQQSFQHGMGTHANSVIAVTLPANARRFKAMIGIDNNYDTGGVRGSVQFAVEIAGKEVFRSKTLTGPDAAVPVDIKIPQGTQKIILKTDTTPDGPAHDQCDWADAQLVLADGSSLWVEGASKPFFEAKLPFSFRYGGVASAELLKKWPRTESAKDVGDHVAHVVTWTDPATGLKVEAVAKVFKRYPAAEWLVYFENTGSKDTPILENIQALDLTLQTGNAKKPGVLHQILGDQCNEKSFLPVETPVEPGKPIAMAPQGGRPSNGTFPFFNYQYDNTGIIAAIGWSGQWAASLARDPSGLTHLTAGIEKTHFLLHAKERVRGPRILVMQWKGDRVAAHNRFRRLMLFHYVVQRNGRALGLPIAGQCFDRYWIAKKDEWVNEAAQLEFIKTLKRGGCDTYWFDAAWFEKRFPDGVGNWFPDRKAFPRGMEPMGRLCRDIGMQFILWFEPERVAAGTQIAREQPQFVFGGTKGGLYKLNDPEARKAMTETLSRIIRDYHIDVYRNDFNIDPLSFWRGNDAPDRQGITEIRYVEGHYAMWDELRSRHPGLWIDNCASGGRRIDLETCMRSAPLWRSDTSCWAGHPDWDQTQTQGLSLYIPLFTGSSWSYDAYTVRSGATGGAIIQFDFLGKDFSFKESKAALDEVRANQKYWYGDFYSLTKASLAADGWTAYQFHRADLDAGIVLAFRRGECCYPAFEAGLHAVQPDKRYTVDFVDDNRTCVTKTLTGKQLADGVEMRIPKKGQSLLIRYRVVVDR